MSNKYFDSANNPNRALPYEVARAEQINNTDDLIEAGFNLVKADVNRAIKLPADVTTDQVLTSTAAQRQNSLLAFDASGNATLTGTDVAARTGKVMGWDSSGNINLYSYANDITAPVNAAASSASAAAVSATNSANSATSSANSATASANSANSASTSANTATTQAGIATTKATEAATSATNAANSATTATTQATNAASSATSAATSATTATTQATNASNSATAAATSATNAANSATAASNSASTATTKASEAAASAAAASNSAATANAIATNVATGMPNLKPSLNLQFANTKTLDPRITFTRASKATRFNQDGYLEEVSSGTPVIGFDPVTKECIGLEVWEQRTNLLTMSNRFDNAAWIKSNANITVSSVDSTVAPSGTTSADTATISVASTDSRVVQAVTVPNDSSSYSASVFIKRVASESYARIDLRFSLGTTALNYATVLDWTTLSISVVAGGNTPDSYSITSVGNGWYRYVITGKNNSTGNTSGGIHIYPSSNSTGTAQVGSLYIWGAQLEVGAFPTPYIPSTDTFTSRASTGTYYNSSGVLTTAAINEERLSYNPANLKLAPMKLYEVQSTNLIIDSDVLTASIGTTVTANTTAFITGATTADSLYEDSSTGEHYALDYAFTPTAGQLYTWSFFVKAGNVSNVMIRVGGGNTASAVFTFSNETLANYITTQLVNSSVEKHANGWFRLVLTWRADNATNTVCRIQAYNGILSYTGNPANFFYVGGRQLEALPYATSYIPTTTAQVTRAADVYTSAQTTRAADVAYIDGENFKKWYRQDEGSFVVDYNRAPSTVSTHVMTAAQTTSPNSPCMQIATTTNTSFASVNNSGLVDNAGVVVVGSSGKYAAAYKLNDNTIVGNGSAPVADISVVPPTNTMLNFGANSQRINQLNGSIKSLTYYPKRLSNSELQALTQG